MKDREPVIERGGDPASNFPPPMELPATMERTFLTATPPIVNGKATLEGIGGLGIARFSFYFYSSLNVPLFYCIYQLVKSF